MRTVTRLTGLSPALLRAWESRFGFVVPQRGDGGHRLYSEDDVGILRHVRALLAEGRSIGEVALAGRDGLLEQARGARSGGTGTARAAPAATGARARDRGGPLVRLRERVIRSAAELDEAAAAEALDAAFAAVSPEVALSEVVSPAASEIGALWASGRCGVAGEHLVSGLIQERLRRLLDAARVRAGPLAICACFPDELHEIGSLVVAYTLSRVGYRVAVLGASLPFDELDQACDRLRPAVVCLSVARESVLETHVGGLVPIIEMRRGSCAFFVGGEGVRGDTEALEAAGASRWRPGRAVAELASELTVHG